MTALTMKRTATNRLARRAGVVSLLLLLLSLAVMLPGARPHAAGAATVLNENFNGVAPPRLPAGWTTKAAIGDLTTPLWASVAGAGDMGSTALVLRSTDKVAEVHLETPDIHVPADALSVELSFIHKYDFESGPGAPGSGLRLCYDLGLMETLVNGVVAPSKGHTVEGGYDGATKKGTSNPRGLWYGWCGMSNGPRKTVITPSDWAGKTVRFRWVAGFDDGKYEQPWTIDNVMVKIVRPPVISFDATANGKPYNPATGSAYPVTVTAKCDGDGAPVTAFSATASWAAAASTPPARRLRST